MTTTLLLQRAQHPADTQESHRNRMSRKVAAGGRACHTAWRDGAVGLYGVGGERKYVNAAERCRILAASSQLGDEQALFVTTLVWTGARISEVLALTVQSVQTEAGTVALRTLKQRRHIVREVPLPPTVIAALDSVFALSRRQREPDETEQRLWTFCRQTGWRLVKAVMEKAEVNGRTACPRGLRHGFGVGTVQAGVPITQVQRWLGHARLSTTAIYADASGPEQRALAERFWAMDPRA